MSIFLDIWIQKTPARTLGRRAGVRCGSILLL